MTKGGRSISLAYLTIPGVEPLEQVHIAGQAGYDCVSLRTIPMGQPGEPQVCLERDPQLVRELRSAMQQDGVRLLDIELVRIREDLPSDYRAAFEAGASLGATDVLCSVWSGDAAFSDERCATICEQAKEFGLTVNLEFPIVSSMTTLAATLEMQKRVAAPNLKILMDMIYVHWDKVTPETILAQPAEKFGLVHLCDCPKDTAGMETVQVVREGREYCGEGAADLNGLLRALPNGPYSIELPNAKQIAKLGAAGHAAHCLQAAKAVFEAAGL